MSTPEPQGIVLVDLDIDGALVEVSCVAINSDPLSAEHVRLMQPRGMTDSTFSTPLGPMLMSFMSVRRADIRRYSQGFIIHAAIPVSDTPPSPMEAALLELPTEDHQHEKSNVVEFPPAATEVPAKRKPGRPRKKTVEEPTA